MPHGFQHSEGMASNCNALREITSGLATELKLRSDPSPMCVPPLMSIEEDRISLLRRLQTCVKTSPRNANSHGGFGRGIGGFRAANGLSPSQSGSSESSMSSGGRGHFATPSRRTGILRGSNPGSSSQGFPVGRPAPLRLDGLTGRSSAVGRGSGNVNVGGARAPNSSSVGRGKNSASSAAGAVGCPPAKEAKPKKKRKRPSKKPHTEIVYATRERFRAVVEELTGYKPAQVELPKALIVDNPLPTAQIVRPQPERPERPRPIAVAVPLNVEEPSRKPLATPEARRDVEQEAGPEAPAAAMVSAVRCASSSASDRAQDNTVSYTSGTSSGRSELNYTFYGSSHFPFGDLEEHSKHHLNPPGYDSEQPDDYDSYAGDLMHDVPLVRGTTAKSSFEVAAAQGYESKRQEDISTGPAKPSGNTSFASGSCSAILDRSYLLPSEYLERRNRPRDIDEDFQMEEDATDSWLRFLEEF